VLLALAQRVASQPILLLLTYRSDEVSAELAAFLGTLGRERLSSEVRLSPLSMGDVGAMIRAIFGLPRLVSAQFLEALCTVTEGNPFFVEETLKSLIAAGDIVSADGQWDAVPFGQLRLPRSVQLAVQRRLDLVAKTLAKCSRSPRSPAAFRFRAPTNACGP
jgi:hypothetical protein